MCIMATLVGLSAAARAGTSEYDDFREVHRQGGDTAEMYAKREAIFEARQLQVATHNARHESWFLTLNRFADFTPAELAQTHGYKRAGGRAQGAESSFLQTGGDGSDSGSGNIDVSELAKTVDWTGRMNSSNFVHDQGACGSCWAHAAVAALEAHAELNGGIQGKLATQEIIDCSTNPRKCGGTGGCQGSTSEIAFQHAKKNGLQFLNGYKSGNCPKKPQGLNVLGFVRLPENKACHLQQALANVGPVVMSVDANNLHLYGGGVFSGCQPDTIVNHAVLGVGYGTDPKSGKDYWRIKNSWATTWGEKGYFRIEKGPQSEPDWYCGTDVKPQDGVFCEKHPATVRVCGMCGSLSDSAYPITGKILPLLQRAGLATKVFGRRVAKHIARVAGKVATKFSNASNLVVNVAKNHFTKF